MFGAKRLALGQKSHGKKTVEASHFTPEWRYRFERWTGGPAIFDYIDFPISAMNHGSQKRIYIYIYFY